MRVRVNVASLAVALPILLAGGASRADQSAPALPPLPHHILQQLRNDPAAWQQFRAQHPKPSAVPADTQHPALVPVAAAGWQSAWPGMTLSNPLLLTDGTVMAHVSCTGTWYRLTPDNTGSYVNGTWAATAPMPSGYAPRFFASAVLPDGRMIVEGGEYNDSNCDDVETTRGAIYDPKADTWTSVPPPAGWTTIGDAESIVLPDGRYMLSNCCTTDAAILDPVSLTWTLIGTGKYDENNEENWTLLPNGNLLTVDSDIPSTSALLCNGSTEIFSPSTGRWSSAGTTPRKLADCYKPFETYEAPTQILMPNGKVVAFGATVSTPTRNAPVYTSTYNTLTGTWGASPNMPKVGGVNYTMSDAPAAVLLNGTALIAASPSTWTVTTEFPAPTHFFTFNGNAFTQIADVADSSLLASYEMNFLVLPTGDILGVETDYSSNEIYSGICCAAAAWKPTVTSLSSTSLTPGSSYSLSGTQLSGRTQGAAYGDDAQADTNFPLVRIVNTASGHVFYAPTSGFGRSVAAGAVSSTKFLVPAGIESGPSKLYVVANGIASAAKLVTVAP